MKAGRKQAGDRRDGRQEKVRDPKTVPVQTCSGGDKREGGRGKGVGAKG